MRIIHNKYKCSVRNDEKNDSHCVCVFSKINIEYMWYISANSTRYYIARRIIIIMDSTLQIIQYSINISRKRVALRTVATVLDTILDLIFFVGFLFKTSKLFGNTFVISIYIL